MKKIKDKFYFILFLFLTVGVYGQLQNANWYFGDHAGLDFNTSPPTVLTDGLTPSLNSSSASISDSNGELLFYTDGHTVWNKNNQIMTGSLDSFPTNFVSAVVISPYPNSNSKYIIFTSIYLSYLTYENYYSIVDMQHELGNVELLNNPTDLPISDFYDNLVMAKHGDGISYWLISVTDDNTISCLLVNETGPTNTIISSDLPSEYFPIKGYEGLSLSISPDDSKLAFGTYECTTCTGCECYPELYIFDFNNITGYFTPNVIDDVNNPLGLLGNMNKAKSVEFSSNGEFLYVLGTNDYGYEQGQSFVQLKLETGGLPEVTFTGYVGVFETYSSYIDMSRALDDKIYMTHIYDSNQKYLSVINNPNSIGSNCNFVVNQIDLISGSAIKLPYLVPKHEYECIPNLFINEDVLAGEIDIQHAGYTITATNTIFSGGIAEYDARRYVLLDVGFSAEAGKINKTEYSHFYAYIEGCELPREERENFSFTNENSNEGNQSKSVEEYTPIKLYPNPTNGTLTIESDSEVLSWEIRSAYGELQFTGGNTKQTIDTSSLPNGIYYLKGLLKDAKLFSKTIVKQ